MLNLELYIQSNTETGEEEKKEEEGEGEENFGTQ
jgi:hypothetical protein